MARAYRIGRRPAQASKSGFPELPDFLVGLTSLGATAYIANKWAAHDAAPHIERVVPDRGKEGDWMIVYGSNLLTVSRAARGLGRPTLPGFCSAAQPR
ncbi:MAG TPA: hypothetical protein VNZ01_09640 [Solirubrobacteraceae bacterium]|jgi:hypothetical protein|nr:hypothetical protein [Solirubrobacteraceae bacterium]